MSSQASSAGRAEAIVRRKLIQTGAVDVMIGIRGNFFYTRTVPCQLWFFDRAKERDAERADRVLMLDARNIYRKVSRAIFDFSPEQQKNIAAIVWLYRGQADRFLKLFATEERNPNPIAETWGELIAAQASVSADIAAFTTEVAEHAANWNEGGNGEARGNATLHKAREALHDIAERFRNLTRQIDLAAKPAGRTVDIAVKELDPRESDLWDNTAINKARKALEEARTEAFEALRQTRYLIRQADWLQERFPEAMLGDIEGLVKLVDRSEIESHDWSLTPGRYVGVAPEEEDENFDFGEAMRSIHIDLKELNEEAAELAVRIARNFEELGI